ncbi:hypothetical protein [Streptomyces tritici]|uniref:hypothetical protein n=1 Tax=Streptomyces tritici TaxID=2054410 RepID=UPI003AF06B1C
MTRRNGSLTALHLALVWAVATGAATLLGLALFAAAWSGGAGASLLVLALGLPLTLGLLATAALPVKASVPLCDTVPRRLGWAALVFVLGTLGVLAGVAAYGEDVDLGSAGVRIALVGLPYTVAAAFFVPNRWVRLGALAVLATGVAYGGFVGPDQAEKRRYEAELARYRAQSEMLYLASPPPGMHISRAELGPAAFTVDYRPVQDGSGMGYVGLVVRSPRMEPAQCLPPVGKGETCTRNARGELITVRTLPDGVRHITLVRRHHDTEVEVSSQSLDETGLRHLLDTLHAPSDEELDRLMREEKIVHRQ